MSAELVPVDNVAALDTLPAPDRELAVTGMLNEARSWLAHAVEATEPKTVADFKAWVATIAESTKQLNLSKEIQLDAQEMVRRAERGVGVAIRQGQDEGSIETVREAAVRATQTREVNQGRLDRSVLQTSIKPRPLDYATHSEWTNAKGSIADLTDDVTDAEFDEAITEAKAEGNLSRANVVRKVRGVANHKSSGQQRLDRIHELASRGWTSDKIARDLGHTEKFIRQIARDADIDIPGDRAMAKTGRRVDHDRILQQTVSGLEGMVLALNMLDLDEVDLTHADQWATSLNDSIRVLNRFNNKIKEMTQ